jgi:hypothetical protein
MVYLYDYVHNMQSFIACSDYAEQCKPLESEF